MELSLESAIVAAGSVYFLLRLILLRPAQALVRACDPGLPCSTTNGTEKPKQRDELQKNDDTQGGRVCVRGIVSIRVAGSQPNDDTDSSLDCECAPYMQDVECGVGTTGKFFGE